MEEVTVYLRGRDQGNTKELCYRVKLPFTTNGNKLLLGKRKRKTKGIKNMNSISPIVVAKMYCEGYGYSGSWDVIGDDIYWIGGFTRHGEVNLCRYLLKHNIEEDSDPAYWKVLSSDMNIRRICPFLAALTTPGKYKKQKEQHHLCVLAGQGYRTHTGYDSNKWNQYCGEIYHVRKKTWECIDELHYHTVSEYTTFTQIARDVDKPTEILFNCLGEGSTVLLDVADGGASISSKGPLHPADFDLWMRCLPSPPPKGLDYDDVCMLKVVTGSVRAVLADSTLYWCTYDCSRLYGYDTKTETWLRSRSLKKYFRTIELDDDYYIPQYPFLLGLGNGKFVLVFPVRGGYSAMALLTVDKTENSLAVSVDRLDHLYFDDDAFLPQDGKAMLKNTGSGSMQGCV